MLTNRAYGSTLSICSICRIPTSGYAGLALRTNRPSVVQFLSRTTSVSPRRNCSAQVESLASVPSTVWHPAADGPVYHGVEVVGEQYGAQYWNTAHGYSANHTSATCQCA
ncbi:MAG: hypothetical protein [Circular genetic element sp.]|nr:MAG: hypothetical protein [Circular genetic element sp.]